MVMSLSETPPREFNITRYCLAEPAQKHPDKTALIVTDGRQSQRWSYRQLFEEVQRTARVFRELGIAKGERVVVRLDNDAGFVCAFFGALAAGLVPVSASPQLTSEEVGFLCEDSDAQLAVVSRSLPLPDPLPPLVIVHEGLEKRARRTQPLPIANTRANDPAFLIYTSGTTGRPKGVLHAHRSVWARRMMLAGWSGLAENDVVLHTGKLNWTYTLGVGLMDPWAVGATSVIYNGPKDPRVWPVLVAEHGVTVMASVPTVYRQILKYADLEAADWTGLTHGLTAGEALSSALLASWRVETDTVLYEALGMSECSTYISTGPGIAIKPGCPGLPQPGRHVAILPLEGGTEPLPVGEVGLLAIHKSDPGLMLGYWNRPEEEAEVFRGDWFIGGDLARLDEDGYVWFEGRHDDLMNSFGHRVSPNEVEGVFSRHPAVLEVGVTSVLIRPDVSVITAFIVPRDPDFRDTDDLLAWGEKHLARYKQPREIRFLTSLPRTPNGKVRRSDLAHNPPIGSVGIHLIDIDDPRYEGEFELRYRVLRKPLGYTRQQVTFPFEADSLHLVALVGNQVIGCLLFHPHVEGEGRLFQMAVSPEYQRRGVGQRLVRHLEGELMRRGFHFVKLHAREEAVRFYEKLGYHVTGEPFEEVGIPHRHMEHFLRPSEQ